MILGLDRIKFNFNQGISDAVGPLILSLGKYGLLVLERYPLILNLILGKFLFRLESVVPYRFNIQSISFSVNTF